jgi:protein arginine N-methyltransferase 7
MTSSVESLENRSRGLNLLRLDMQYRAYHSALYRLQIEAPVRRALEIGSGDLAMMAIRAGACWAHSLDLDEACFANSVPHELPERADLAILDAFDVSLIGDGVLEMLSYAREHLLTEAARYLPMSGRIRGMLVESDESEHSPTFVNVDASRLEYWPLSDPFDVFEFDFAKARAGSDARKIHLAAVSEGTARAVLFWFDLQITPGKWLSNEPQARNGPHWKQALQALPEARVAPGLPLSLNARHDGRAITFEWPPA